MSEMSDVRKVPASAGAEWLLGGIALLRRAPLTLGLLGLIWGGLSTLGSRGFVPLSLLMGLAGPILFAGVLYAVREVDQDRVAKPSQLLQGVRSGKAARLLAMLLPNVVAMVVVVLLLVGMVGTEQLQRLSEVMVEMQTNPDPARLEALLESLPLGAFFGWFVVAIAVGVVSGFFTFIAIPEVMFNDRGAFDAMAMSLRACMRNLGALLVMLVLVMIGVVALSLALQLVGMLLAWVIGMDASIFVVQVMLMAILIPVFGGAVYLAWRQIAGDGPAVPPRDSGFEA